MVESFEQLEKDSLSQSSFELSDIQKELINELAKIVIEEQDNRKEMEEKYFKLSKAYEKVLIENMKLKKIIDKIIEKED